MNTTITIRPTFTTSIVVRDLRAAVRSEWIKLRSVRSTAIFAGLATVLGVAMTVILGRFVKDDPYNHKPFTVANTFLNSTWLSTLFAIVAGTLLFTTEVQHGTLAGTLTARPARRIVVGGKAAMAALLGFAMGALGIIGSFVGSAFSGMRTGDMSRAPAGIAWALFLTSTAAVLGLGVGIIVRHSSAAVTAVLVWALAVENLVRGMVPATISRLLPFSAAGGLLGIRSVSDTDATLAAALPNVGNAMVIGGWTVAAMVIGTALLNRKDA